MSRDGIGFTRLWLAACVVGLVSGAVLVAAGHTAEGHLLWGVTTVIGGIPVTIDVIRSLARREAGVDVIAILAILGCLGLHQYAAGAVIAVMLASGQALEDYADRRAHRELSDLLARAPRQVHRYEDGELQTREIDEVVLGDRLFVKSGEVVPVDGVLEGDAVLDESALSGSFCASNRWLVDSDAQPTAPNSKMTEHAASFILTSSNGTKTQKIPDGLLRVFGLRRGNRNAVDSTAPAPALTLRPSFPSAR